MFSCFFFLCTPYNSDFTFFSQKISTQVLTWLTISVIVQLEQRKGNKKESRPDGSGNNTSEFSDSANYKFFICHLKGDMTYDDA